MNPSEPNNFQEEWVPLKSKERKSTVPSGDYVATRIEKFKSKLDEFIDELKEQNLSDYITNTHSVNKTEQLREDKLTLQRIIKMKDFVISNLETEFDKKVSQANDLGLVIQDLQQEVLDLRRQESEFLRKISQLQDQMFAIIDTNNSISQKIQKAAVKVSESEAPIPNATTNYTGLTLEEIINGTELGIDLIRILNEKKEIKLIILAMMLRTSQDMCLEIISQLAAINYLSVVYSGDNDHNPSIKLVNADQQYQFT